MAAIACRIPWPAALILLGLCPGPARADAPVYGYEVVHSYPHDGEAFTQGLIFRDGFLYESTGIYGASSLRKVVLETGIVVKQHDLPAEDFGEGITAWQDTILQITWRNFVGYAYVERDTFDLVETFSWAWEGWGLAHDGARLITTDGSSTIRFLDPQTLEVVSQVVAHDGAAPVPYLNELEYLDGKIYANVLPSDRIAVIDPGSGLVLAWLDLGGLQDSVAYDPDAYILNGIAFDETARRLFVTGKWWPKLFEIDVATLHPESVDGGAQEPPPGWTSLRVFPNPSHGPVRVSWTAPGGRAAVLQIFDLGGRRVLERTVAPPGDAEQAIELDPGPLPSGSYVVRIVSGRKSAAGLIRRIR